MGPQNMDIYKVLDDLRISFLEYKHQPFFTCEDAEALTASPDACQCKNLFLRNRKGDKHFLLIIPANKQANLKNLESKINEKGISLASPERLEKYLGLKPGSVSPFGLINNSDKSVVVLLDQTLLSRPKLLFHPNANTATLEVSLSGFLKFLEWTGNRIVEVEI